MVTAGYHGLAARAEGGGDGVGPRGERGHEGYPHQVHLRVEVERLDVLVADRDLVTRRRRRRHRSQGKDAEPERSATKRLGALAADAVWLGGWKDEEDLHGEAPWGSRVLTCGIRRMRRM